MAKRIRSDPGMRQKADGSLVTLADTEIEGWLQTVLPELVPGTTVWGEEAGHKAPGPNGLWLVDPIDGTTNYAYGSPLWGVSVALLQEGQVVLGGIVLPDLHEVYSAHVGGGATCNGQPLPEVKPGPILDTECVSYSEDTLFAFPSYRIPGRMRYNGAFVAEAAFMAKGAFRGIISLRANLYDIAAAVVILTELGAEFRGVNGQPIDLHEVVANGQMPFPFVIFPKDSGFCIA